MRATALHTWLILHASGVLALAQSRQPAPEPFVCMNAAESDLSMAGSDMVALAAWVAAYRLGQPWKPHEARDLDQQTDSNDFAG